MGGVPIAPDPRFWEQDEDPASPGEQQPPDYLCYPQFILQSAADAQELDCQCDVTEARRPECRVLEFPSFATKEFPEVKFSGCVNTLKHRPKRPRGARTPPKALIKP